MPNIGKAIKAVRKKRGLNQIEFGKLVGLTQTYISQIESGNKHLHPTKLTKISEVLEVPEFILMLIGTDTVPFKHEDTFASPVFQEFKKLMIETFV